MKALFFAGILINVGASMSWLATPAIVGQVIDGLTNKQYDMIEDLMFWYALIIIGAAICDFVKNFIFNTIGKRVSMELKTDLYQQLICKDITFFDEHKTGELLSRLDSDTGAIRHGISYQVVEFIRLVIFISAMFFILFSISPFLTGSMICCMIPVIVYQVMAMKKSKVMTEKIQDVKAECSVIAEETFANARTVKAFATEEIETQRFKEKNAEAFQNEFTRGIMWAGLGFSFMLCIFGSQLLIILLGSW
jgi:ABC-type multidrug transport system fused ATPase/permease subunit